MAGNNKLQNYATEKDTLPRSTVATGTISAVNGLNKKIVGVGTAFTTEFRIGDWVYVPTEDELRKVEFIVNDTELTVSEGFTNAFSGVAFNITPKSTFRLLSWSCISGSAVVDGVAVSPGESDSKTDIQGSAYAGLPDPVLIDATGGVVHASCK